MKQTVGIWTLGLASSVILHLGAGAGLMAALQPEPVEDQPVPESQLNVEAQQVPRSTATQQQADAPPAETGETSGTSLGSGAIAQSTATAQDPAERADTAAEVADPAEVLVAEQAPVPTTPTQAPTPQIAAAQAPAAQATRVQTPQARPSPPVTVQTTSTTAQRLPTQLTPSTTPVAATPSAQRLPTQSAAPAVPTSAKPVAQRLPAETAAPGETSTDTSPAQPLPTIETASSVPAAQTPGAQPVIAQTTSPSALITPAALPIAPDTPTSVPQEPDVTASKAVLAFPAAGNVDPVSLAAFQSFTQPESAAGTDVRDSLTSALAVPCSRMQVTFDPDTTTLQLTGHVPDPADRAPVLAALQQQMGADITVEENLLVLPAPQCGALSGIADVGLPQSTDQITNPLIVGSDTHARAFRYVTGDPLVLDLTAPDYPAYVYVDYFDADGNVIHLAPNDRTPLTRAAEKSALQIGARAADEAGLFVTIGPPYGQEIAAAFAASVPLYEGTRPLVEPAEPYLAWLKTRIAEAREEHADFKGEWVYFFVTTAAN